MSDLDEKVRSCRRLIVEFLIKGIQNQSFLDAYERLNGLTGAATAEVVASCVSLFGKEYAYLEVGIYQACNLVLVANSNSSVECFGVDNFSQDFQENKNFQKTTEEVVQDRIEAYCKDNCSYIKSDFREFLSNKMPFDKKVGVYFFDGPHELQDQIDGVEMALPHLADRAIIFVDDLSSPNVQASYTHLVNKYSQLTPVAFLHLEGNDPRAFNQGQVVLEYRR